MEFESFIAPYKKEAAGLSPADSLQIYLRAIPDADNTGEVDLRIRARVKVMNEARSAMRPDMMIVTYPSLLAILNETDDPFHRGHILWFYKFVIYTLPFFVQPSRSQIEEMLEDFVIRYEAEGAPQYLLHLARRMVYKKLCDVPAAMRQQALLETIDPPWSHDLMDDKARVTQWEGDFWCFAGHYEKVFRVYKPLLSGTITHRSYNNKNTWATLLWPAWKLSRFDEGDEYFRNVLSKPEYFEKDSGLTAELLVYAAVRGFTEECAALLRTVMPVAMKEVYPRFSLEFYACAVPALRLLRSKGTYAMKLSLATTPAGFPFGLRGEYSTDELAEWCRGMALNAAKQYDVRNGNTYLENWVLERVDL